ncbi:hypothetical protein AY599_23685 [Leptolyngbya valderiana BDU 20041]|nr:hypothetical protein AY599_23685 [Leptolyngbya valderiana BDU 20041]
MTLDTLANVADIVGAFLVIVGVIFGVIQIRYYRAERHENATMEIMRAFQTLEFTSALRMINQYQADCRRCSRTPVPPELQEAMLLITTTLESIGLMVYRRLVPFRLVQQLMGGSIQAAWSILREYVELTRQTTGRPSVYEWFQWLAEQLDRHPEYLDEVGAYEKFSRWKPERD